MHARFTIIKNVTVAYGFLLLPINRRTIVKIHLWVCIGIDHSFPYFVKFLLYQCHILCIILTISCFFIVERRLILLLSPVLLFLVSVVVTSCTTKFKSWYRLEKKLPTILRCSSSWGFLLYSVCIPSIWYKANGNTTAWRSEFQCNWSIIVQRNFWIKITTHFRPNKFQLINSVSIIPDPVWAQDPTNVQFTARPKYCMTKELKGIWNY